MVNVVTRMHCTTLKKVLILIIVYLRYFDYKRKTTLADLLQSNIRIIHFLYMTYMPMP